MGKSRQAPKYTRYTLCHPNGEVEHLNIPRGFGPWEVCAKYRHALVFMHINKGFELCARTMVGKTYLSGPACVLLHEEECWAIPRVPQTETEAYEFFKTCLPKSVT